MTILDSIPAIRTDFLLVFMKIYLLELGRYYYLKKVDMLKYYLILAYFCIRLHIFCVRHIIYICRLVILLNVLH